MATMDSGTAEKIVNILAGLKIIYEYTQADVSKEDVRSFRSYLSADDFKVWLKKEQFEVAIIGNKNTSFNTQGAMGLVTSLQLQDKNYRNDLIIKKMAVPTMPAINEVVFNDFCKLLKACHHLSSMNNGSDETGHSYVDLKTGHEYRIYPQLRGVLVLHNRTSILNMDDGDMKNLMNLLKIAEYEYHQKLEDFGLKQKGEIRQQEMQIMTML